MQKRLVKFSLITSLAILLALPTVGLAVQNANVAGKWLLTISTPRGDSTITLNIEQDGSTLTGTSLREGQENSSELTGTIDGNNITLNMRMGGGGGGRGGGGRGGGGGRAWEGVVDGNTMSGEISFGGRGGGGMAITWTATKQ
jgi:hypothetical protein